jgi:deoxyribodipyrimidine photo-lyase
MDLAVNPGRIRVLKENERKMGSVIYWMSRDQRVHDNWALLFAQDLALKHNSPLGVVFCLVPEFLQAARRQYCFLLRGLKQVERTLGTLSIPFFLLTGSPGNEIPKLLEEHKAGALVADFCPLRISRGWKNAVAEKIETPFYEVDAHNIVPCWIASAKQEWAAYTFRPKINRLLPEFLREFPDIKDHPTHWKGAAENDWITALSTIKADPYVPEVTWVSPGEAAAAEHLRHFIDKKLQNYESNRNDPTLDSQSGLSPYLHFGQISAQRIALSVLAARIASDAFLEELIVRKELSDNFCFYNRHYDSFQGFPGWAKETLDKHRDDEREVLYSLEELEHAKTHDELWNASQMEMALLGKMHGYMRMYWAKKILEWTQSPEEALKIGIYLNDKYELDGRDPNGYVGIAWSMGGVHDRAWRERAIFGKVRYMSLRGISSKFDVEAYMQKVQAQ